MKVKEEREKVGLKLNILKTKIMASGPITSWQIVGETMETVTDILGGGSSKITADGDCSHEIKRCLLLGRKVMTNLRSEEHTSELQSPTHISYAVFCLKKNFFNDTATTEIYTLSLHDALPISAMKLKDTYSLEGKL